MCSSVQSLILGGAACVLLATGTASAADPALNILFYGNSYTTPGDSSAGITPYTVPYLVKGIAQASGRTAPNVENASAFGATLAGHLADSTRMGYIGNPIDFTEQAGFMWNYVVMQEMSTIPTNITDPTPYGMSGYAANPATFKNNAQSLYNAVKTHSSNAKAVLFETWATSPNDTADLPGFYTTPATNLGKADRMSAELHQYYGEASVQLGTSNALVAHVGDAFKASNYEQTLYKYGFFGPGSGNDWRHPSPKGALLAGLVIYGSIYQTDASLISYSQMNTTLTQMSPSSSLSYYGIDNVTEWNALTTLADSVAVPEPASLGLLASGVILLARRRS